LFSTAESEAEAEGKSLLMCIRRSGGIAAEEEEEGEELLRPLASIACVMARARQLGGAAPAAAPL
jgi:hypothetical protein